jgi:hypothetical protein
MHMPKISKDDYAAVQACMNIEDIFQRRLTLVALITKIVRDIGFEPPIIVGGTAVSIYSSNIYATVDVDFISNSEEACKDVLLQLGYVKTGKDYYHKDLESLMEFPTRDYCEDSNRFVEYTDPNSEFPVFIIGIEDLILDRVESFSATGDLSSKEWSTRLMLTYYNQLDWSYLHSTSYKRGFFDKFEKLQQHVKYLRQKI